MGSGSERYFEGSLRAVAGEVTRIGEREDGMVAIVATEKGAVKVTGYYDPDTQRDMVRVEKIQWQGQGEEQEIYRGQIGL